jgi:hypothetical protein
MKWQPKKPEIGMNIQFRNDLALAVLTTFGVDMDDAVHHQHVRQRQLGVAGTEQLATGAGKQFLMIVTGLFIHDLGYPVVQGEN